MSDINFNVPIPEGTSPEEEERLVQAAIDKAVDKKINDDLDDMFKGFPTQL